MTRHHLTTSNKYCKFSKSWTQNPIKLFITEFYKCKKILKQHELHQNSSGFYYHRSFCRPKVFSSLEGFLKFNKTK